MVPATATLLEERLVDQGHWVDGGHANFRKVHRASRIGAGDGIDRVSIDLRDLANPNLTGELGL